MVPKKITIGGSQILIDNSQFLREVKYEILGIGKIVAKGDKFQHKIGWFRIYDTEPKGEVKVSRNTEFDYVYCCTFCDHIFKEGEDPNKHIQSEECMKARNKK